MILLLGGTSETAPLAASLAHAGYEVLVSTATDIPLRLPTDGNIRRRSGPLGLEQMSSLFRRERVEAVVDATHPYAVEATTTAQSACRGAAIPYLCFVRPPSITPESFVHLAPDHERAAGLACSFGRPVLLTIGTRNLDPYVREARAAACDVFARVLADDRSIEACKKAGIAGSRILAGRGPFSVEENRKAIRAHDIGIVVTKDSGEAGGAPAKIEAARHEGCEVVVIERPQVYPADACHSAEEVVKRCLREAPIR
ncbi:MAG: precorrin-6A reductase [Planctomycetes bacterium]|jgi:precorrin-6A/cobalt-precorrin-6A reductase|nr:precorrin-6A reductase [Planctomycetota bacterium]